MEVKIIPCLNDNYSYLIFNKDKKIACVVDPGEAEPIIKAVKEFNINLKYILNTHHHYDHIGGNKELKQKFNTKIIGYKGDQNKIPDIDFSVEDNQTWSKDGFEIKIFHIPGHTLGHICFYFPKDKIIFTGDTLFSLGCGRIFEGTYKQMFDSLNKIKNFPPDTKVYCGHEYTLQNSKFCIKYDPDNLKLKNKIKIIKKKIEKGIPTVPSKISEEIDCNIFLKAIDLESFSKLRDLKDNF
jgi:hydroxyacylglutathione hydrolase